MLRFPANAMASPLEGFLQEVRQTPPQSLMMPIQFHASSGLGGAVQAVQAIATWARVCSPERAIRLPRDFASNDNSRARFASTLPGMSALYFSNSILSGSEPYSRLKALEAVVPRISAMQSGDFRNTLRGQGSALCCFMGAKNEFLHPLYSKPATGEVRDQADFRILVTRILDDLGIHPTAFTEIQKDYLCGLIYQLFLNADEHGSFNENGERYPLGLRGISIRLTTFPHILSLISQAGDDDALKYFISKLALADPKVSQTRSSNATSSDSTQILELCVFDTGPGLGLRWLAEKEGRFSYKNISFDEEFEAVQTCFKKHATTKVSQFKGEGLSMALKALTQLNAFVALRTGRLSLYQDLSKKGTSEFQPVHRFPKMKELAEIAGTSYSIYFRMR